MRRHGYPHGFTSPKFLWQKENTWLKKDSYDICKENPEVKHSLKTNLTSSRTTTLERLERISTWSKIKWVVVIVFRFKAMLLDITKSLSLPSLFNNWFLFSSSQHNYETSWSSLGNLRKPSYKTNLYGKNSIIVSAINTWNNS